MRENTDQKNYEYGHILRSDYQIPSNIIHQCLFPITAIFNPCPTSTISVLISTNLNKLLFQKTTSFPKYYCFKYIYTFIFCISFLKLRSLLNKRFYMRKQALTNQIHTDLPSCTRALQYLVYSVLLKQKMLLAFIMNTKLFGSYIEYITLLLTQLQTFSFMKG